LKKSFLFILLILLLSSPAMAQYLNRNTSFNFNAGNLGVGANLPMNENNDFEVSLSLANFGIENQRTGIGIEFSPFATYFSDLDIGKNDYNEESYIDEKTSAEIFKEFSFLNVSIYLNVVNLFSWWGSNFFFGPFITANYMFMSKDISWDKYVITAGIQMGFRTTIGNFNYKTFSFEFGYRNINGTPHYHLGGKIDLITLFFAYLLTDY